VTQVLRRLVKDGSLKPREGREALDNLRGLDLEHHDHGALLARVWALRENLTAHDAVYVALAEALGATLLTCDHKLGRAAGMGQRIRVLG